jgi:nucleotide-binding universal stress UspA family protein
MRILFATDGSSAAESAEQCLNALPLPPGSAVHALTVIGAWPVPAPVLGEPAMLQYETVLRAEQESAEKVLAETVTRLQRDGVEVETHIRRGEPAFQVLHAAEELEPDLLVVGSHGRTGLEAFILGSVARNVAKHARCPVLIARAPREGLRRVVLAVDDSEHASHAAGFLARLPLPAAAEITVVHVLRPYDPFPGMFPTDLPEFQQDVEEVRRHHRAAAEALVEARREQVAASGHTVTAALREGNPAAEVLAAAAELPADLVVAGARGASLIEGLLVGSVADRLLKQAPCSVLIVR